MKRKSELKGKKKQIGNFEQTNISGDYYKIDIKKNNLKYSHWKTQKDSGFIASVLKKVVKCLFKGKINIWEKGIVGLILVLALGQIPEVMEKLIENTEVEQGINIVNIDTHMEDFEYEASGFVSDDVKVSIDGRKKIISKEYPLGLDRIKLISISDNSDKSFTEKLQICNANWEDMLDSRMGEISTLGKETKEYGQLVTKANSLTEKYNSTKEKYEYWYREELLNDIIDIHQEAKEIYRQAANEFAIGDCYLELALLGTGQDCNDLVQKYYTEAIKFYIDGCVISNKNEKLCNAGLRSISQCYYAIGCIDELDSKTKEEMFLSSYTVYMVNMWTNDDKVMKINLERAKCCSQLMVLMDEPKDKYACFINSVELLDKCLQDADCGSEKVIQIYKELMNNYQYCFDFIDPSVYQNGITKQYIMEQHGEYEEVLDNLSR